MLKRNRIPYILANPRLPNTVQDDERTLEKVASRSQEISCCEYAA